MEIDIYKKFNNYIELINKRYTTLINGFKTNEANIDDIFYVGNNYSVALGLVSCLNTTPYLEGLDNSLNIKGGVCIKKNLMVDDLLTGDNNLKIEKIVCKGNLYVEKDNKFGNVETNNIEMKNMDVKENINGNILLANNNMRLIFNNTNIKFDIKKGNVIMGNILMNNNRYGYIKIIEAKNYDIYNFIGYNVNGNIVNFTNFQANIYNTNNIYINNFSVNNILYCQNLNGYKYSDINDTITIKREQLPNTTITSRLVCNKINNTGNIITNNIKSEILKYNSIVTPLCRDNLGIRYQLTLGEFTFEYADSYSFILVKNINFTIPSSNANYLTILFDNYIGYNIKPDIGKIFYSYGIRSSTTDIFSVIYKIDYFYTERSEIRIYIVYDQNNDLKFITGFQYNIYRFNYNYYK